MSTYATTIAMFTITNKNYKSTFEFFHVNTQTKNGFTILELNPQSCADLNVFDELKLFISEYKTEIDVIVQCETWFNPNLCDLYKIEGYNSYHSCRETRNGGGVSIYVLNTIVVRNAVKKKQ